jgi:hypothetical protein
MKKIISVLFLAVLISGCSPSENEAVGGLDLDQKATSCAAANGKWLAEQKECEYVSKEWCDQEGGVFQECGSACRHNPEAEMCTKQCVIFCKF